MVNRGRRGSQPKMLPKVLRVIADMKDMRGTGIRNIVNGVYGSLSKNSRSIRPSHVTMQVRKALRHGITNGIIVQQGGKYRLVTHYRRRGDKDSKRIPVTEMARKPKRGKRRQGKRKRRRRRESSTHSSVTDTDVTQVPSTYTASTASDYTHSTDLSGGKKTKNKRKSKSFRRSASKKKKKKEEDEKKGT